MIQTIKILPILIILLTFGCTNDDEETPNDPKTEPSCPFTFPTPVIQTPSTESVALLTYATFPGVDVDETGADGKDALYLAVSAHRKNAIDGSRINGANITYIQTHQGSSVLFKPKDVAAEYERIKNNAINTLDAKVSNNTITLDGQEANVLIAQADDNIVMTVFVPIDEGQFFAPVSIGVNAGQSGCTETMKTTAQALQASISLNPMSTYNSIPSVAQTKAQIFIPQ